VDPSDTERPATGASLGEPVSGPLERFDDAPRQLLAMCAADLDAGLDPVPTLAAFIGDRPLALVGLRPFAPGEIVQALVEVLALLLPLGCDRLALALPGRAWSLDDPIVPVTDDGDLRQRVLMLTVADARGRPCELRTTLHPFEVTDRATRFADPISPGSPTDAPVVAAVGALLDARDELRPTTASLALTAQFGRVLLLGHELSLAPSARERLVAASSDS
jgi:hypothetical protein